VPQPPPLKANGSRARDSGTRFYRRKVRVNPPQTQTQPDLDKGPTTQAVAVGQQAHLLATEKLAKAYRQRRVVNGVSIYVGAGEIVGLLGPNGAGKTTTFNIVVGLVKPDEGHVRFQEREVTRLPMHRRARLGTGHPTQG